MSKPSYTQQNLAHKLNPLSQQSTAATLPISTHKNRITSDSNQKAGLAKCHAAVLSLSIAISSTGIVLPTQAHAVGEALLTGESTEAVLAVTEGGGNDATVADDADIESDAESGEDDSDSAPVPTITTEKDTAIDTKTDTYNDVDIRLRIEGIFNEIEGLNKVIIKVNQGVVTLSGQVPNEKKALQAVNLANRLSDVVAVNDSIERTLDVQDNVTPVLSGLKQKMQGLVQAAPLLLVAIFVFGFVAWIGGWISRRQSLWQHLTPNPFVAELVSQTIKAIFIIIGLILALSLIGAEAIIGTLLGSAGVIGIAVGFAVKDTIENYIASLMLSVRQPFRARDHVKINDYEGIVVRLTSRATILMTLDGNRLRIPNSEVFKGVILNYTRTPERRFEFKLGVDANDDPLAAIKVGIDAINELDFILTDPKVIAIIDDVGDSNIVLLFQAWVNQTTTDLMKARSIAIREAKHALENTGFSLPEPIYKVRFKGGVEEALEQIKNEGGNTGKVAAGMTVAPVAQGKDSTVIPPETEITTMAGSVDSISDAKAKIAAKERAKQVLGEGDIDDVFNAEPDPELLQKVEEEISDNSGNEDLLSSNSPEE